MFCTKSEVCEKYTNSLNTKMEVLVGVFGTTSLCLLETSINRLSLNLAHTLFSQPNFSCTFIYHNAISDPATL